MFNLLKKSYLGLNTLSGKQLYKTLGITFVVFILLGIVIGYFTPANLNKNEQNSNKSGNLSIASQASYHGIVTYLGEGAYPSDKIMYSLVDTQGKEIILLKATDQKLSIAEGLEVTVTGNKTKTNDNKYEVLTVTEVTFGASN